MRGFRRERQGISGTQVVQEREHHVESERGDQVENVRLVFLQWNNQEKVTEKEN